ncbi:MAG: hypothetical protein ABIT76_13150 [Chthoniobacterales bacterium]
MTNSQKNKLSMFLAVLGIMQKYNAEWMSLTAFAALVTQLGDLAKSIQDASGVQGTPQTGIAGGKSRKQVEMAELTVSAAGDLHTLAVTEKDDVLAAKADVELTTLLRMEDTLVGPYCRGLYDLCLARAADIALLGTTAADLAELDAAITAYTPLATAPRQAIVVGAGVTGNILLDTTSGMTLLTKQLDKAMRKFKRKNPEFFNAYTSARIIVDLGGGHADNSGETPAPPPAP